MPIDPFSVLIGFGVGVAYKLIEGVINVKSHACKQDIDRKCKQKEKDIQEIKALYKHSLELLDSNIGAHDFYYNDLRSYLIDLQLCSTEDIAKNYEHIIDQIYELRQELKNINEKHETLRSDIGIAMLKRGQLSPQVASEAAKNECNPEINQYNKNMNELEIEVIKLSKKMEKHIEEVKYDAKGG